MPAPMVVSSAVMDQEPRSPSPLSSDDEPSPYYDRKRTRTLRFPCKARGVLDNHNARTAYIDVPADASHGTIVICSHPSCKSSGRKFRYCSVCMIPVAKRNFSKRHGHGLLEAPFPSDAGGEEEMRDDESSRGKRQRQNSFRNLVNDALHILDDDLDVEAESHVPKTIVVEPAQSVGETLAEVSSSSIASGLTAQEHQWLDLLHMRPAPTNEAATRAWMSAILETAELRPSTSTSQEANMAAVDNEDDVLLDFLMDEDFLSD